MTIAANLNTLTLGASDRKYGTWLAYAYLFFYYVRPQEYIPGMSALPLAGVIFLVFAIWGGIHFRMFFLKSPIVLIVLLGCAYLLSAIDALNVNAYRITIKAFTEFFPHCLALYILFDSKDRVTNLLKLWNVIYFFVALITIKNGGRGPGDFTLDENDAALALAIGFPICFYGYWYSGFGKKFRYFSAFTSLVILAGIVVSSSRGGFLGLIAAVLILWWFSPRKFKIALYAIIFSITMSGVVISLLPDGYIDEMQSINDTEDDTRVQRLQLWETAWEIYKDNIFVGVGVHNQRYHMFEYARKTSWYSADPANQIYAEQYQGKVVHSVYFQVLSETGSFGAIIYLYIMFILPIGLLKFTKIRENETEEQKLIRFISQALIAGMGAHIVAGAFISVAYYPHLAIWVAMYAIVKRLYIMESISDSGVTNKQHEDTRPYSHKTHGFKWENQTN